jgi:hypothetical protein
MLTPADLSARSTILSLLIALAGCGGARSGFTPAERSLHIATTWPLAARVRLEQEFRDWRGERGRAGAPDHIRLSWMEIPGLADRGQYGSLPPRADVLLGGPLVEYFILQRRGQFARTGDSGNACCMALHARSAVLSGGMPTAGETVALDDPRSDPATLAWCVERLRRGSWPAAYAGLVRLAGHCVAPLGWRSGTAQALLERGEVRHAIRVVFEPSGDPASGESAVAMAEGAAVLAGASHESLASEFLLFLAERRGARALTQEDAPDPAVNDLLSDLLGSTLVDSQDELSAAWAALGGADAAAPSPALAWMTEPPPWPPASVEKLLVRGGDQGLTLAHDLAGQLAPEPELRFWLIQSWLRPRRQIDLSLLGELGRAAGGRLVREPRFRSWLRSEWTAWARQRYRRVGRLAMSAVPAES